MNCPQQDSSATKTRLARLLLTAMLSASTLSLTSGCVRLVVIPADKEVVYLKMHQPSPKEGYLVPEAKMLEILDALGKREVQAR
jgi:hypothetical protein